MTTVSCRLMSRMFIAIWLLAACCVSGAAAQNSTPGDAQGGSLLLTGARMLDVEAGQLRGQVNVAIEGNRIAAIGESARNRSQQAETIDLTGYVILPGMIDLHSHLLLHPYDEATWNDQVLVEPLELRTIRGVRHAEATLAAGFTTLRDLGTEGAAFADVAIRDAIREGIIPGPRVFAVTKALVTTGGYGPAGFDPRWRMPKGAQVADGVDGVKIAVREQIAAGADWIKVYADYRRKPGDPSTPTYSQEELTAIVDEATSAGVPVAAHATTVEGMRRAVLAGVKTIEHGYQADEEVLQLMKEHNVFLCPTLTASESMARYSGWKPGEPDHQRITDAKELMRKALAIGVPIANGSDVGVFTHGDNARELELMHDYGMPTNDVLRTATTFAAKVLDREGELGIIRDGAYADIVAIRGNPLENISALRDVVLVIKNGEVVIDRRDTAPQ